jgi:hypothetical protein
MHWWFTGKEEEGFGRDGGVRSSAGRRKAAAVDSDLAVKQERLGANTPSMWPLRGSQLAVV